MIKKRLFILMLFLLLITSIFFVYTYYQNQQEYIMIIDINGEVTSTQFSGIYELRGREHLEQATSSQNIVRVLDSFSQDDKIKAFIIRINATEGQTVGQEEIVREIHRTEKPVIAVINGSAFSAGYYIAAGTDKIYAEESSLIGDIAYTYVYVNRTTNRESQDCFISSKNYDQISSEDCPSFDADVFYKLHYFVSDSYIILLDHISSMRGLDVQYIKNLTQNQTFTGKEALDLGLIDEIGTTDDAISFLENSLHKKLYPIYLSKIIENQKGAISHEN